MGKYSWQQAAGSGQAKSHMPAASLGHYASLSLVVVGRRRDWDLERHGAWGVNPEVGGQTTPVK